MTVSMYSRQNDSQGVHRDNMTVCTAGNMTVCTAGNMTVSMYSGKHDIIMYRGQHDSQGVRRET